LSIRLKFVRETRKDHKCQSCGKDIPKGSSAINGSGLDYDNNPINEYTHISSACHVWFSETVDLIDECDIVELIEDAQLLVNREGIEK